MKIIHLNAIMAILTMVIVIRPAEATTIALSGECNWHIGGSCEAGCEGLFFHAACDGEIGVGCGFGGSISIGTDGACKAACEAECVSLKCEVDLGGFDCEGYCAVDCSAGCCASCEASCAKECETNIYSTECESTCQASCEGSCEASCAGKCAASCIWTPPNIDCEGGCRASCDASCRAKLEVDYQLDCEAEAYLDCEAELKGECMARCEGDGYLECNGEFIDEDCYESAVEWVETHSSLTNESEEEADCEGDDCNALLLDGSESGCSVSQVGNGIADGRLARFIGALLF